MQNKPQIVAKAVAEFNKYRTPEATAKLVSIKQRFFEINFSGSFCHTCGFRDYFDDLRIFLEDFGLKTKIAEIKETGDGAVAMFEILKSV